jgi:hypothetical protein
VFTPWIKSLLEAAAPRVIVEVGVATGGTTVQLLELASRSGGTVHAIDPSPQPEFDGEDLRRRFGKSFVLHQARSLDALARIDDIDAVLIDGDHNWFTVYNELKLLERSAGEQKRPFPLTFVHDVDWPYGRRDLYYDPDSVPEEHRQPFRRAGIVPGQAELAETGGFNNFLNHAVLEGTPRNGVRTAVEDFLSETELALEFQSVAGFHGVGILFAEQQLRTNEGLRNQLEYLKSAEWLGEHCKRLEWGRAWAVALLDGAKQELEEANLALAEALKALESSRKAQV